MTAARARTRTRGGPRTAHGGWAAAYQRFVAEHPEYDGDAIDALRATEYGRLDDASLTYLDYTGAGLYADTQVKAHFELLAHNVLGNPHSGSHPSRQATELVESARNTVLSFFKADPRDYEVIFTPNASGAIKLVGESYPFETGSQLLLTWDNHTSVNGLRQFARAGGATVRYAPMAAPALRIDHEHLSKLLKSGGGHPKLFAYPAQSNFSGVQHDLGWIEKAHGAGWDVLLDAAAFVATNELDLGKWQPDFVPISFYKMFGYPTGVGCLLARRPALAKLTRPWFAGGTIVAAPVQASWYALTSDESAFEDGTLNFLDIPAVAIGLNHLTSVGISRVHARVMALTDWLLSELSKLNQRDGAPGVVLYGPHDAGGRGGTVAFNFLTRAGHVVDERLVELTAAKQGISIRTGCFCNAGAGEAAFGISGKQLQEPLGSASEMDGYLRRAGMESGGAVRVSVGIASNFADVWRLLEYARRMVTNLPRVAALPARRGC